MFYRVSIQSLIQNEDNNILMIKDENGWDFPGGGLKLDESPFECLLREIKEEIGVEAEITSKIPVIFLQNLISSSSNKFIQLTIFYRVRLLSDSIKISNEAQEYKWFSSSEIKELKINPKRVNIQEKLVSIIKS